TVSGMVAWADGESGAAERAVFTPRVARRVSPASRQAAHTSCRYRPVRPGARRPAHAPRPSGADRSAAQANASRKRDRRRAALRPRYESPDALPNRSPGGAWIHTALALERFRRRLRAAGRADCAIPDGWSSPRGAPGPRRRRRLVMAW